MDLASYLLFMFLRRIPMLLVSLCGGIVAIKRWKRHPRASLLTVLALAIYWVEAFVFICLRHWLPSLRGTTMSNRSLNILFTVLSVSDDFVYAIVIILLVAAALIGRRAAAATTKGQL